MANNEQPSDKDILWRQYSLYVDLYKFYLELSVKINIFYYAITGTILTYYLQHSYDPLIRYALLLPLAFSLVIGGVFFYGAMLLPVVRMELFSIRDKLGLDTAPELQVLVVFLYLFGSIMILSGIGLSFLFWKAFS